MLFRKLRYYSRAKVEIIYYLYKFLCLLTFEASMARAAPIPVLAPVIQTTYKFKKLLFISPLIIFIFPKRRGKFSRIQMLPWQMKIWIICQYKLYNSLKFKKFCLVFYLVRVKHLGFERMLRLLEFKGLPQKKFP